MRQRDHLVAQTPQKSLQMQTGQQQTNPSDSSTYISANDQLSPQNQSKSTQFKWRLERAQQLAQRSELFINQQHILGEQKILLEQQRLQQEKEQAELNRQQLIQQKREEIKAILQKRKEANLLLRKCIKNMKVPISDLKAKNAQSENNQIETQIQPQNQIHNKKNESNEEVKRNDENISKAVKNENKSQKQIYEKRKGVANESYGFVNEAKQINFKVQNRATQRFISNVRQGFLTFFALKQTLKARYTFIYFVGIDVLQYYTNNKIPFPHFTQNI
ncbi:Hypothetical_protein [Hexamita inflata]|uniref:Hypothetical_protein n=1 Tax=Hexamita inflata TaxID=28002 RepID=A0AA86PXJ7_9EUKA|nr:Hypothetical protein HINF_LOCUS35734 [Hexamita inflata]